MRLSLSYEMQRPVVDDHAVVEETIEQCVLADKMGFDAVWFVEHHFLTSFSMSPCPEVIFGALSRLTKHIRLGFGVVILPITIRFAWRSAWRWSITCRADGSSSAPGGPPRTSRSAWGSTPARRARCGKSR